MGGCLSHLYGVVAMPMVSLERPRVTAFRLTWCVCALQPGPTGGGIQGGGGLRRLAMCGDGRGGGVKAMWPRFSRRTLSVCVASERYSRLVGAADGGRRPASRDG